MSKYFCILLLFYQSIYCKKTATSPFFFSKQTFFFLSYSPPWREYFLFKVHLNFLSIKKHFFCRTLSYKLCKVDALENNKQK